MQSETYRNLQMLGFLDQDGYLTSNFDFYGTFNVLSDREENFQLKAYLDTMRVVSYARIYVRESLLIGLDPPAITI